MERISDKICKEIIKTLAKKCNVDPKLIVTRLMSEEDKEDMRNGLLPIDSLELHVRVWIEKGMPDYAHGHSAESADVSDKRESVTPAPLIPPLSHNSWELREPFMRPEENVQSDLLEESHLDKQIVEIEIYPT